MKENQQFVQVLATVILIFGAVCVGAADKYNWRDLAQTGATIVGCGAGILTGQKMSNYTSKDGSLLSIAPDPKA